MFIKSNVALQNNINKQSSEKQSTFSPNTLHLNPNNQEERWGEGMALHLHMKNRKKYTHLYELEKYFK
jgi:hypothetical protein